MDSHDAETTGTGDEPNSSSYLRRKHEVVVGVDESPAAAAALTWARGGRVPGRARWDRRRFGELFRFSWLFLADTGVHSATPAVLTFLVNAHFGAALLGQLNIAMRIVEPLRSATDSVAGAGADPISSSGWSHRSTAPRP